MTDRPGEGYVYRYSQLLKRLLSAKGGEPILELAAELVPTLTLEVDRPEWAFISGTGLWIGQFAIAAGGAGNRSIAQVFNPVSSGVISVLLSFIAVDTLATVAQAWEFARDDTARGTDSTNIVTRDTRSKIRQAATQLRTVNNAAVPGGRTFMGLRQIAAPVATQLAGDLELLGVTGPIPIVLGPGTGVDFEPTTDNVAFNGMCAGYERPMEASEAAG